MSERSYADEAGLAGFGAGILAGGVKAYTKKPENKLQAFKHRFLGKKPSVKDILLGAGLTGVLWSGAGIGLGSLVQKSPQSNTYDMQLKEDNFSMDKQANVLGAIKGFGRRAMGAAGRGIGAASDMAGAGVDAVRGATAGLPVVGAGGMAGQAQLKAQLAANAVRRGLKSKIRTFKSLPLSHQAGIASASAIGTVGLGAAAYKQASEEIDEETMVQEIEKFAAEAAYDPEYDMEGDNELAKLAAEELYQECLEKMAFAEELYAQAMAADEIVKQAAYEEFNNYDFSALDAFHEQKRMERAMEMLEKEAGVLDAVKGLAGKVNLQGARDAAAKGVESLVANKKSIGLGAAGLAALAGLNFAKVKGLSALKRKALMKALPYAGAGAAGIAGLGALGGYAGGKASQ